jgi:hypothetical protein
MRFVRGMSANQAQTMIKRKMKTKPRRGNAGASDQTTTKESIWLMKV